ASCHSGQGEVTSEGLYGLQRAFKKAGVETMVLSLWEASDNATKCFMTNFYSDLLNGSRNRHSAFEFARRQVRERFPLPFYWAGFVLVE
ncbi:MAG: CHAT domain-containing protein, partial [Paramuribaculum sp.]|nr:CHAT domain-containing protein [Paramuribaculum sp.]